MSGGSKRLIDALDLIAETQPGRVGLIVDGDVVRFGAFRAQMHRMADALGNYGLRQGQLVAVAHPNLHVHLLILGALDMLGLISASFRDDEGADCHALVRAADLVLSSGEVSLPGGRHGTITPGWLRPILDAADAEPVRPVRSLPATDDDPVLMIRSSGTTGHPKRMLMTRAMLEARFAQRVTAYAMNADSRYLATMNLSVSSVLVGAMLALSMGGMAMADARLPLPLLLPTYQPTHMTMLPFHLTNLLDDLPPDFARMDGLTICMIGARLPPTVRQAASRRLSGRIVDHYGANEVGLAAELASDGTATPASGVTIRIVDPDGVPVPHGVPGRVRIRGAGVVRGYCDDEARTAAHFRSGWFWPDDFAVSLPDGRIRLAGRAGDVLNIGGLKMACGDLEASIRDLPEVRDVAILVAPDDTAEGTVVAVVPDPSSGPARVREAVGALLPPLMQGASIRLVDEVARTREGKIRRDAMRRAVLSAAAEWG